MSCAYCGSILLTYLGELGKRTHFRCRACGSDGSVESMSRYVEPADIDDCDMALSVSRHDLLREEYAVDTFYREFDFDDPEE